MNISAHGISVEVPRGWDARIFQREESAVAAPHDAGTHEGGTPRSGFTFPILHLGSFPLPDGRGDYGSGAVQKMLADDVFVALGEFESDAAGSAMFATKGLPQLRGRDFHPQAMQRPIAGMAGVQRFVTMSGRAFGMYAVVGSFHRRADLSRQINAALGAVTIARR